jgi:probable addiction module antidote protein
MRMNSNDYKTDLLSDLRDPEYAAGYLSAAKAESQETFLLALRDVAEAQKGVGRVAKKARVNRENLYRMLSKEGNPRLSSLDAVLSALGFRIIVQAQRKALRDTPRRRGQR